MSLLTKDPRIARMRASAMTAFSEGVRVMLEGALREGRISEADRGVIYRRELIDYRDRMEAAVLDACGGIASREARLSEVRSEAAIWNDLSRNGIANAPSGLFGTIWRFRDLLLSDLVKVRAKLKSADHATKVRRAASGHLKERGIPETKINVAWVMGDIVSARAKAAELAQQDPGLPMEPAPAVSETSAAASDPAGSSSPSPASIPEPWRSMTPRQIVQHMLEAEQAAVEHRQGTKREARRKDKTTLRQLNWAASLLEHSMMASRGSPEAPALWELTRADLLDLDKWFDRLPRSVGRSEFDRRESTTLAEISARGAAAVGARSQKGDPIALDSRVLSEPGSARLTSALLFPRCDTRRAEPLDEGPGLTGSRGVSVYRCRSRAVISFCSTGA